MDDLPLHKHHRLFHSIINHELHGGGWNSAWDPAMKTHPEARSADYDMLVNSKPYFLFNASVSFSYIHLNYPSNLFIARQSIQYREFCVD
jgi:hypothetical protein